MKKPKGFYSSMKMDDWFSYGVLWGYNNMEPGEIREADKTYYLKGIKEKWIGKRKKPSGFFKNMSMDEWLKYGLSKGYDKTIRDNVSSKESAYYQKGMDSGWMDRLIPKPIRKENGFYSSMNKDKWLAYGFEKKYNKMIRSELASENSGFYRVGLNNKWLCGLISASLQGSHFKKGLNL